MAFRFANECIFLQTFCGLSQNRWHVRCTQTCSLIKTCCAVCNLLAVAKCSRVYTKLTIDYLPHQWKCSQLSWFESKNLRIYLIIINTPSFLIFVNAFRPWLFWQSCIMVFYCTSSFGGIYADYSYCVDNLIEWVHDKTPHKKVTQSDQSCLEGLTTTTTTTKS